uniref:DUF4139 domain-containing protein n=1 Tax=Roseivirga sp. TaxID=1964215 RepID=UPI0040488584
MKLITLLIVMFMAVHFAHGQVPIESKIESIEVYTKGAEISRSATLKLKQGKNEFQIHSLSSNLDPKTIQIVGEGFTILSVRHELDYLEKDNSSNQAALLLKAAKGIEDSIALIDLNLQIIEKEISLLNQNQKIIGDQGIQNQDFQNAVGYFAQKFKGLLKQEFDLKLQKNALTKRLEKNTLQIDSYAHQDKNPSSNIFIVINSDNAKTEKIEIHYAVKEAGWFPAYDVRAKNTSSPLSITYKARVYQNTGIDWKNVKLRIATGDLESSGTAPELRPYFIGGFDFYPNRNGQFLQVHGRVIGGDDGLPLPQVTVLVKGTTLGVSTDENGFYSIQLPNRSSTLVFRFLGYVTQEIQVGQEMINVEMQPDITSLGEVVVTGFGVEMYGTPGASSDFRIRGISGLNKEKKSTPIPVNYINYQTNFVYDILLPYDIPSTGKPEVVDMLTKEVEAEYVYSASPKALENAYLVAMIKDWTKLNLLDGESNLYFENRFVGKSIIDSNIGSDTLNISLGKDEGIVINRERLKDFEERKFFSSKKREERHFKITVVNTKSTEINIMVYDQIPLAVKDNVKISILEMSEAELDKETGLLKWQLSLKPGEKKELRLKFVVEYPRDLEIQIN